MLSILVPVRNKSDNLNDIFNYFFSNLKYEVLKLLMILAKMIRLTSKIFNNLFQNIKVLNNKKRSWWSINLGIKEASGSSYYNIDQSDDINDLINIMV